MNRWIVLLALSAAMMFAGCGGGNTANAGGSGNTGNSAGGHGHGDEHTGEGHDLGDREKDGFKYEVVQIGDLKPGAEGIFEFRLKKDDKAITDATVTTWIGDKDGKELTPRANGAWMADENCYDCHMDIPKDLPADARFWVTVKQGGSEIIKDSFELHNEKS
ncbi:MAG: hypothetical protein H6841_01535 [Planctomycetes bacterium]|nr:hypothetical protein [Planctomycetota bacterium]MCB9935613.1 hypothetical protein [Planctomycetota bacterium]